ncbi:Rne/Rng family ribonuclease [Alteribacillus iranensis]|uniref:RNAse G n=1 Tax=Alteribacillus iranensis TaxID=930128 RepID=A0A1I2CRI8_9BACI|nr:Rne/Rng family ribonuclease [Alteribacillus iranensis]SFE70931.1 RNAse G [Alteribacillus iranensis]
MYEIICNTATTEKRAAVKKNGELMEIRIEHPDDNRMAGNIYKGRVKDVIPGMEAAFVDIGREKNGYLSRNELISYKSSRDPDTEKSRRSISEFITEGQEIIVQVTKEEFGDKGARLTENVTIPGAYTVYMPAGSYIGVSKRMSTEEKRERWRQKAKNMLLGDEGIIIRTMCEHISENLVKKDLQYLREDWEETLRKAQHQQPPTLIYQESGILARLLRDYPIEKVDTMWLDHQPDVQYMKRFVRDHEEHIKKMKYYTEKENIFSKKGVEKQLDRALQPKVWLKSGGFIIIEHTEAMTVVDVNTGRFTGKANLEETIRKTNIEAAEEIARQLRLRDISGIIIIDFIDMKEEKNKDQVLSTFQQALKEDRTTTNVRGFSPLGLVEMTRKKVRRSLADTMFESCKTCRGGKALSRKALVFRLERLIHEHREEEAEALVIEIPERVIRWLEEETELVNKWQERYSFCIYLCAHESHESIDIRFMGGKKEAEERVEKWPGLCLEV